MAIFRSPGGRLAYRAGSGPPEASQRPFAGLIGADLLPTVLTAMDRQPLR